MEQPPDKIYLQWYGDDEDPFGEVIERDVTWCREKIWHHDIEYVKSSSTLSIADIAAQRGMEPQEVVHELVPDKNGITCYATKDSLCYILNEETNRIIRLPYTAITPALIKAVCGGE